MSEVAKMYENAGIKTLKDCKHYLRGDGNWCNDTCDIDKGQGTYSDICYLGDNHDKNNIDRLKCHYCEVENFGYPPFTAEKQIELIKLLASSHKGILISDMGEGEFNISTGFYYCAKHIQNFRKNKDLSVVIAEFINNLWQDLTEQERTEIAEILKG